MNGKKTYEPDWRPAKRVKNPKAMKAVHEQGCFCVLNCGDKGQTHHLLSKGQRGDDVAANLICLCLHHHNLVHAEDTPTLVLLGEHLLLERPDVVVYVKEKLGDAEGAAWLARRLFVTP